MSKLEELRKNLLGVSAAVISPQHKEQISPQAPVEAESSNGFDSNVNAHEKGSQPQRPSPQPPQDRYVDAVDKLSGPAQECQERWAELAESLAPLEDIARRAASALQSMKVLCAQMQKLSVTFEPMRVFEHELAAMASSFSPMKELHSGVTQLMQSFRNQIAQLAESLEPVAVCRRWLDDFGSTFDAASELQAQFRELSEKFSLAEDNHLDGAARSPLIN